MLQRNKSILLTVIGYKCHGRIKNQRALTENLNNAKGFEHLFSIARRVGKVDDLVTDLDFQLP